MSDTAPQPIQWQNKRLPLADLKPYGKNPRKATPEAIEMLKARILEVGFTDPIICDHDLTIAGGHQRRRALMEMGITEADVRVADRPMTHREFQVVLVSDNVSVGGWDVAALSADFKPDFLEEMGLDLADLGMLTDEDEAHGEPTATLGDKFGVPPFTVLDARQGYWQDRKRQWMALGIRSELGRDGQLIPNGGGMASKSRYEKGKATKGVLLKSASGRVPDYYKQKNEAEARVGRELSNEEFERDHLVQGDGSNITDTGTSVFDPVLCELAYRWFSPAGGTVLDPFAGGSVRGVVASLVGRQYIGMELRGEQAEANRAQWPEVRGAEDADFTPVWKQGDSCYIKRDLPDVQADMLFSCPPYADLEVYSTDPADISNMPYDQFLTFYRSIIIQSCAMLKDDRFAVWVVGEVREKKNGGVYRGLIPDTIRAFEDAGLSFYNEAVLVTPTGSLAMRAGRQFSTGRKMGKNHQNVLVFVKGNPKAATEACGEVEVEIPLGEDEKEGA